MSFFLMPTPVAARRLFLGRSGGLVLSGAAVALLAGNDALAAKHGSKAGDIQILNNHLTLHSRTEFEDHDDPALKRTLFRLWLAPPDSPRLPDSWKPFYRSVAPGTVRGGIIGQAYDDTRRAFERRAAADLRMTA